MGKLTTNSTSQINFSFITENRQLTFIVKVSALLIALLFGIETFAQQLPIYRDVTKSIKLRTTDLLKRLMLEEKISLLGYQSKSVPRLGIPFYNWWKEALHGVARAGEATFFPQAIDMAASFDDRLLNQVATNISTEARAKYNIATAKGDHLQYHGLTFWSPNINIFRDPGWGRGQETYGEEFKLQLARFTGSKLSKKQHLKMNIQVKNTGNRI